MRNILAAPFTAGTECLRRAVAASRRAGASWEEIGETLGTTARVAHDRYHDAGPKSHVERVTWRVEHAEGDNLKLVFTFGDDDERAAITMSGREAAGLALALVEGLRRREGHNGTP